MLIGGALDGHAHRGLLQDQAQVVQVFDILERNRRDQVAEARDRLDVAFLLEPLERLADGREAKVIALDQLRLGDRAAGIELAGQNIFSEGGISLAGKGFCIIHPVDFLVNSQCY